MKCYAVNRNEIFNAVKSIMQKFTGVKASDGLWIGKSHDEMTAAVCKRIAKRFGLAKATSKVRVSSEEITIAFFQAVLEVQRKNGDLSWVQDAFIDEMGFDPDISPRIGESHLSCL